MFELADKPLVSAPMSMRVLMLAPPGGGKGTQGKRLAQTLGVEHISSGDLLRAAVAADTPLGREVDGYLKRGELAPDAIVTEAIRPILATRENYVLDGFPRKLSQTEGVDFDVVVYLDVPDEVVTRRLLGRGRADDRADVIAERLRHYEADTAPLVDYYERQGVLLRVDGDRPDETIAAELAQKVPATGSSSTA
jgi:adenylate kinase